MHVLLWIIHSIKPAIERYHDSPPFLPPSSPCFPLAWTIIPKFSQNCSWSRLYEPNQSDMSSKTQFPLPELSWGKGQNSQGRAKTRGRGWLRSTPSKEGLSSSLTRALSDALGWGSDPWRQIHQGKPSLTQKVHEERFNTRKTQSTPRLPLVGYFLHFTRKVSLSVTLMITS